MSIKAADVGDLSVSSFPNSQKKGTGKVKCSRLQKIEDIFDRSYQAQLMDHRAFYTSWSIYSVLFRSDKIAKWEDADFILLSEEHGSEACRSQSGCFISNIAKKSAVTFLLEGFPSMEMIHDQDSQSNLAQQHFLDSTEKVQMCGWDNPDFSKGRYGLSIGCFLVADSGVRKTQKEIATLKREIATYKQCLDLVDDSLLPTLSVENLRKFSKLSEAYKGQLSYLKALYEDLVFFQSQVNLGIMTDESFLHSFPRRTYSMVATLEKLQKMVESGKIRGKVVLIAGTMHLKTPQFFQGVPEFDLSLLHDWLKQHRAVVMLPSESVKFLSSSVVQSD